MEEFHNPQIKWFMTNISLQNLGHGDGQSHEWHVDQDSSFISYYLVDELLQDKRVIDGNHFHLIREFFT